VKAGELTEKEAEAMMVTFRKEAGRQKAENGSKRNALELISIVVKN